MLVREDQNFSDGLLMCILGGWCLIAPRSIVKIDVAGNGWVKCVVRYSRFRRFRLGLYCSYNIERNNESILDVSITPCILVCWSTRLDSLIIVQYIWIGVYSAWEHGLVARSEADLWPHFQFTLWHHPQQRSGCHERWWYVLPLLHFSGWLRYPNKYFWAWGRRP